MADTKKRPLLDRLRELLDALKNELEPRRPAPVPIPARDQYRRR